MLQPRCSSPLHVATFCAALFASMALADTRLYQWIDARTGTVQLSGTPPSWYRGTQPGPRVFVFGNGRLIDDTARERTAAEAAQLRASAFGSATATPGARPLPVPLDAARLPSPDDGSPSREIAEIEALVHARGNAAGEPAGRETPRAPSTHAPAARPLQPAPP